MASLREKRVERGKKIKNSDLTLLTWRHPSGDGKKNTEKSTTVLSNTIAVSTCRDLNVSMYSYKLIPPVHEPHPSGQVDTEAATVLKSTGVECFNHHKKLYWTGLV